jgi:hypothetical protein
MLTTPPDSARPILESRPDWARGVAKSAGRKELRSLWFGAVIMNTLGLPVGWMALSGDQDLPLYFRVALPAFTLLGLLVFFMAVRDTLRWCRFSRLEMTLDPLPARSGGRWGDRWSFLFTGLRRPTFE